MNKDITVHTDGIADVRKGGGALAKMRTRRRGGQ